MASVGGDEETVFECPEDEHREGDDDAGDEESPAESSGIVEAAFEESADEWGEQGSDVHTHVEDGEGCIFAAVVLRIEVAYHRGDVGFEQSITDDQHAEA